MAHLNVVTPFLRLGVLLNEVDVTVTYGGIPEQMVALIEEVGVDRVFVG